MFLLRNIFSIFDGYKWYKRFRTVTIILILIILYLPLFVVIILSFLEPSSKGNSTLNWNANLTINNYSDLFFDPDVYQNFWIGLFNSLLIAWFVIPSSLFVGIFMAIIIWMNKNSYLNKYVLFSSKVFISMPDIIQGVSFLLLFTMFFLPLGINLGFLSIVLSHIAISIPYVIILLYPKLSKINYNIILSSFDLNHNFFETVKKIIFPIISPNIWILIFFIFNLSFDDFIITNMIKGSFITISSEMYSMKKGIKMWAISFGAILLWLSFFVTFIKSVLLKIKHNNN